MSRYFSRAEKIAIAVAVFVLLPAAYDLAFGYSMRFEDLYGSMGSTFTGTWRFTVHPNGNQWVRIFIPDPTWGWNRTTDQTLCNTQDLGSIYFESNLSPAQTDVDFEHGYRSFLFLYPPSEFYIDMIVGGTVGVTTRGTEMHDYRDPSDLWCQSTPNIVPAEWLDLANQIESQMDSGSLCGNEGLIQACVNYAGAYYTDCKEAAACAAGMLRAKGIPTSIDVTYQLTGNATLGGLSYVWYGGMHAQISTWNYTSGQWERNDPKCSAGFVYPTDILGGRVLDWDYLCPGWIGPPDGLPVGIDVEYSSGEIQTNDYFYVFQYRQDTILYVDHTIASICYGTYKCGKHENIPGIPDAMTGVELKQVPDPVRLLANPSREGVHFWAPFSSEIAIYSVSGRKVEVLRGQGDLGKELSPGVYFYRSRGNFNTSTGKFVVVR